MHILFVFLFALEVGILFDHLTFWLRENIVKHFYLRVRDFSIYFMKIVSWSISFLFFCILHRHINIKMNVHLFCNQAVRVSNFINLWSKRLSTPQPTTQRCVPKSELTAHSLKPIYNLLSSTRQLSVWKNNKFLNKKVLLHAFTLGSDHIWVTSYKEVCSCMIYYYAKFIKTKMNYKNVVRNFVSITLCWPEKRRISQFVFMTWTVTVNNCVVPFWLSKWMSQNLICRSEHVNWPFYWLNEIIILILVSAESDLFIVCVL